MLSGAGFNAQQIGTLANISESSQDGQRPPPLHSGGAQSDSGINLSSVIEYLDNLSRAESLGIVVKVTDCRLTLNRPIYFCTVLSGLYSLGLFCNSEPVFQRLSQCRISSKYVRCYISLHNLVLI